MPIPATSSHWIHDLSPFVVEFPSGWVIPGIRWYGLSYLAGFLGGWWLLRVLAKRGRLGDVRPEEIGDAVYWLGLGVVLGGRIGYCLFYNLGTTLRDPLSIFMLNQGGMASHGGILGVALALGYWWRGRMREQLNVARELAQSAKGEAKKSAVAAQAAALVAAAGGKQPGMLDAFRSPGIWRFGDGIVAAAPLGILLGRLANFVNGELWGRSSDVSWAVIFPMSPEPLVPRHPSQLYAAAGEGLFLLVWLYGGMLRGKWPIGGAAIRFVVGYAAVRFAGEFFREPDVGIGLEWLNLTRGQWLSLTMVVIGVIFWRKMALRAAREEAAATPPPKDATQ